MFEDVVEEEIELEDEDRKDVLEEGEKNILKTKKTKY